MISNAITIRIEKHLSHVCKQAKDIYISWLLGISLAYNGA